jgi:hypothetical protein
MNDAIGGGARGKQAFKLLLRASLTKVTAALADLNINSNSEVLDSNTFEGW